MVCNRINSDLVFSKDHFIHIAFNCILLFVYFVFAIIFWNEYAPSNWVDIIAIMALAQFVLNLLSIMMLKISILDFRFWYVFLIQMFTYGRIYLIAIGYDDYLIWQNLPTNYSDIECWRAGMIALISTQAFFSGLLTAKTDQKPIRKMHQLYDNPKFLFNMGIVLVVVLFPFKILTDIQNYAYMQTTGAYGSADVNGIIGNLALLYPVGLVLLICSRKWNRKQCFIFIILYSTIMFFFSIYTGDRRNVMTSVLTLFLCYLFVYKPQIKISKVVITLALVIVVLYLMVIIRELRIDSSGSLNSVVTFISNNDSISLMDIVWDSFSEYGITYYTYANAVKFYPSTAPFFLGTSYILLPLIAIPGIGQVFPVINDLTSTSKLPESILHYSVGGSFGQEAFANFGLFGGIILFIIGIFFGKLFISFLYSNDSKKEMYYFLLLYFFMSLPRASFVEFSRQVIWTVLLVEIIVRLKYRKG